MTNLTPEEINRALAEWMGWTRCQCGDPDCWNTPNGNVVKGVQKFTESLDLCTTIEVKLTDEQWDKYTNEIEDMLGHHWSDDITREVASLTALQKSTALVRALGLGGK